MHKFAALGLLIGAALIATVSYAGALETSDDGICAVPAAASYEWQDGMGMLTIAGEPIQNERCR